MLNHRTYCHPSTGREAHLGVDRVTGPGGQRWCSVSLVRAESDLGGLDGYPAIESGGHPDKARLGYRERLRALRNAGWQRVEYDRLLLNISRHRLRHACVRLIRPFLASSATARRSSPRPGMASAAQPAAGRAQSTAGPLA